MSSSSSIESRNRPVLILGAGVNGISVARELVLNRVPVWIVDTHDIAFGATAKSSRLIHGGLRYLEYADFRLVAESLHERDRLLRLAPHFVSPLKLHIPIRRRLGGMLAAGCRFLGMSRTRLGRWVGSGAGRGLWTVKLGLWLYDLLARSQQVPRHAVERVGQGGLPFPHEQFPWACSYYDARMECPERYCVALLREIELAAVQQGTDFRLLTYHQAEVVGDQIAIRSVTEPCSPREDVTDVRSDSPYTLRPTLVINATGAWGDWTLKALPCPAPPLFGGTKGSHLFTANAKLRDAIGGDAVYAEAADGRLVFLIPLFSGVMIGTTDERFEDRPEAARTSPSETDYLIALTNELFPQVDLKTSDIYATCAGIRPLPNSGTAKTAAISRDHQIDERQLLGVPLLTLIGGKLTTSRALGEQTADRVFQYLGIEREVNTRERIVYGAENFPDRQNMEQTLSQLAISTGYPLASCRSIWRLVGTRAAEYLSDHGSPLISGTDLPQCAVSHMIRTEWVSCLDDLIERRLLLALDHRLTLATIQELAALWMDFTGPIGKLEVDQTLNRLREYYGRKI